MLILSHRGYHKSVPENTLEAFEQAIALGVDGIETDVRLSADGLPVLFHDRLAPDGRPVAALTRNQLSKAAGYAVPTLQSALERWGDVIWNVEIKTPAALHATVSALGKFQNSRRFLITSFWHNVVHEVSRHLDVPCGLLVAHRPAGINQLLHLIGGAAEPVTTDGIHRVDSMTALVWFFGILDREMLEASSRHGLQNFAWGMVDLDDHRFCAELGLHGIITDHPELLQSTGAVCS